MKKITIKNVKTCTENGENEDLKLAQYECEGGEEMEASDGYHTFGELYEHRIVLFIALCKQIREKIDVDNINGVRRNALSHKIWRSKLHLDGTMFDGWFIMGIGKEKGKQITCHLPIEKWEKTEFAETLENAPEWDGHTPEDVLKRISNL